MNLPHKLTNRNSLVHFEGTVAPRDHRPPVVGQTVQLRQPIQLRGTLILRSAPHGPGCTIPYRAEPQGLRTAIALLLPPEGALPLPHMPHRLWREMRQPH